MLRTIENKLLSVTDFRAWLLTVEGHAQDENCVLMMRILNGLERDYKRVMKKRRLTEPEYWEVRSDLALASMALQEHIDSSNMGNFHCEQVPTNLDELVFVLLNDAVFQFSSALQFGKMRSMQVVSDEEMAALALIVPKTTKK